MKKFFVYFLISILCVFVLNGCEKHNDTQTSTTDKSIQQTLDSEYAGDGESDNNDENLEEQTTKPGKTEVEKTTKEANVVSTEKETNLEKTTEKEESEEPTTKKNQSNPIISDEDLSKIENSQGEVYFSDNPNNKYIQLIVKKYSVNADNLIALIKVNAEFPSTLVLEFSGAKDDNGELTMSYSELKNVYNIDETNNTIVRASKNGLNNDGVSFVEAKILVTLAKEYFIPELQNLKENKRYEE